MKPIFFTSDWHVGHKMSLVFDKRPFKDIEHMHRVLINNYNASVPKDGVCYFLGDMGMCSSDVLGKVISKLNGTKILVLGNHDKGLNSMYNVGFDAVLHGAMLYIANERVTLSHCPLKGIWREDTSNMHGSNSTENWHGEARRKHSQLTFKNEGQFHLHGHIHSHPDRPEKSTKILGRQYDVGVVSNNYRPVSISQIESWIATTKIRENKKGE